jgi:hypothetical protein
MPEVKIEIESLLPAQQPSAGVHKKLKAYLAADNRRH